MLLLLVILTAAYFIWRMRTPASQQRAVEHKAEELIKRNTTQASNSLRRFASRLPLIGRNQDHKPVDELKTWINSTWMNAQGVALDSNADFRELVAWLKTLNETEFEVFIQRLKDMATSLGISLDNALNESSLPDLKTSTEDLMRLCALAVWKTDDIKTLLAYQEWSKEPDKYRDQKFVENLYADLVKKGLVKPNIEALMQTNPQRQEHITSSIRLAASQYGDGFIRLLKHHVTGPTTAPAVVGSASALESVENAAESTTSKKR